MRLDAPRLHMRITTGGRCDTGATVICIPTKRRRHAITETPPVQAALDGLRQEDGVELGEADEVRSSGWARA
jgi:hypothetical protein